MNFNLDNFESIYLSQMTGIKLMKRIDKKYVIPLNSLPEILERLVPDYHIQETGGNRCFEYSTLYYDTSDYEMYKAHHNGKLNRLKIRTREYINSNLCFLEIKTKSNKGITRKIRIPNERPDSISGEHCNMFLSSNSPYSPSLLEAKILSLYNRITLVNRAKTERLTIDFQMSFLNLNTNRKITLPEVAVIEIKKEHSTYSPVMQCMKQLGIKPRNMSKYCFGVASTEDAHKVKINTFKPQIINIRKITPFIYE